jgi:hypothetical protein
MEYGHMTTSKIFVWDIYSNVEREIYMVTFYNTFVL